MNDKNFSQEVLEKIKEDKIKPRPRWEFLLKEYFVWIVGLFALIIGSLSVAVIIYMLLNNDWEVYQRINGSLASFIIFTLPYFWIIIMVVFILLVNFNIKHTKKGYKHKLSNVIMFTIVVSVSMGTFWYVVGAGEAIENILARSAPFYRHVINRRMDMWQLPDKGLLAGIIGDTSENKFELLDFQGRVWLVYYDKAAIMPIVQVKIGEGIKVVGDKINEDEFLAIKIMPIGPGGQCLQNSHPGGCLAPRMPLHPPIDDMINSFGR